MPTLVASLNLVVDEHITDKLGLGDHGAVQTAIDHEVVRLMQPYIPFKQGILAGAFNQTDYGSGKIIQSTPYARYMYYGKLYVDPDYHIGAFHDEITGRFWSRAGVQKIPTEKPLTYDTTRHALAGSRWFDRMKADHTEDILKVAKEAVK